VVPVFLGGRRERARSGDAAECDEESRANRKKGDETVTDGIRHGLGNHEQVGRHEPAPARNAPRWRGAAHIDVPLQTPHAQECVPTGDTCTFPRDRSSNTETTGADNCDAGQVIVFRTAVCRAGTDARLPHFTVFFAGATASPTIPGSSMRRTGTPRGSDAIADEIVIPRTCDRRASCGVS
jgi:hypothetical protein